MRHLVAFLIHVKLSYLWSIKLIVFFVSCFSKIRRLSVLLFDLDFNVLPNRLTFWRSSYVFFFFLRLIILQGLYRFYQNIFLIWDELFCWNYSVRVQSLVFSLLCSVFRLDLTIVDIEMRLEMQTWASWKHHRKWIHLLRWINRTVKILLIALIMLSSVIKAIILENLK